MKTTKGQEVLFKCGRCGVGMDVLNEDDNDLDGEFLIFCPACGKSEKIPGPKPKGSTLWKEVGL